MVKYEVKEREGENMSYDFHDEFDDHEYDDDDELTPDDEVEMDECIQAMIDAESENLPLLEDGDVVVRILNVDRTVKFHSVFYVLRHIIKGRGVKVSQITHEPCHGAGVISIVGKDIRIARPDIFFATVKLATNFEMLPKLDGSVEMNFTFYDLIIDLDDAISNDDQE